MLAQPERGHEALRPSSLGLHVGACGWGRRPYDGGGEPHKEPPADFRQFVGRMSCGCLFRSGEVQMDLATIDAPGCLWNRVELRQGYQEGGRAVVPGLWLLGLALTATSLLP